MVSYSIDIFDSGESFTADMLSNIGLKQNTTHAREDGSGIGAITALEIIRNYQVNFATEVIPDNGFYSNKGSICFDGMGQYRLIPNIQVK